MQVRTYICMVFRKGYSFSVLIPPSISNKRSVEANSFMHQDTTFMGIHTCMYIHHMYIIVLQRVVVHAPTYND